MFRAAYGAGYRAGAAPRPVVSRPDGTQVLQRPACPYTGRWQVCSRFFWQEGYQAGCIHALTTWLERRRV